MTAAALAELAADQDGLNPLHLMLASRARGNRVQTRKLVAMRGLMAAPDLRIMGTPFTLNFVGGHSPLEYLASTFGARKGLADTSLKTAAAGFLFKRIVSAVQDVLVTAADCGARGGLRKGARRDGEREWLPLAEQITGRTAAADLMLPGASTPLVRQGTIIAAAAAAALPDAAQKDAPAEALATRQAQAFDNPQAPSAANSPGSMRVILAMSFFISDLPSSSLLATLYHTA